MAKTRSLHWLQPGSDDKKVACLVIGDQNIGVEASERYPKPIRCGGLASINVADAKQFARDFAACHASSHAKKVIERTWQVFGWAVDANILTANPFTGVNIQATTNKERQFYLTPQATQHVLAGCDHQDIRTIFVLARFCGLRIPHEALALKWDDIDFEARRFRISKATKTGSRVVPMLGAVQELETQYNLSTKTGFVFVRARASAATTWRGWLLDAIKNAGLHGWEKLWVNLRASARTDAGNKFASHTCKEWFGHSSGLAIVPALQRNTT